MQKKQAELNNSLDSFIDSMEEEPQASTNIKSKKGTKRDLETDQSLDGYNSDSKNNPPSSFRERLKHQRTDKHPSEEKGNPFSR